MAFDYRPTAAATKAEDLQRILPQIQVIQVGDLQLAAGGGLQVARGGHHGVVVDVEAGDVADGDVALRDVVHAPAQVLLRHRLVVNFAAESEGISTDNVIDRLLAVATAAAEDEAIQVWYRNTGYATLWTSAADAERRRRGVRT